MTIGGVEKRVQAGEGAAALLLWAGLLGPPFVFLTDLLVSYSLAYWACASDHRFVLDLVTAVSLGIVLACGWSSWRLLESSHGGDTNGGHPGDRSRFLATLGVLSSGFFALAVLAFVVPRLVIGPCYP